MYKDNSENKVREIIPDLLETMRACGELVIKLQKNNERFNDAINLQSLGPEHSGVTEAKQTGMIEQLESAAEKLFMDLTNVCATYDEHLNTLLGKQKV